MQKPNIVFIFTDQQRSDTMGYAGDPVAITPHTDRLAAEGVVFPHCVTSSPVCMTTRASMMTGLQVYQHGVWAFANPEIRHGQSHVRNIRDAGYRTGVVGKTHLWVHGKGHTRDHLDEMSDWGFVTRGNVPDLSRLHRQGLPIWITWKKKVCSIPTLGTWIPT